MFCLFIIRKGDGQGARECNLHTLVYTARQGHTFASLYFARQASTGSSCILRQTSLGVDGSEGRAVHYLCRRRASGQCRSGPRRMFSETFFAALLLTLSCRALFFREGVMVFPTGESAPPTAHLDEPTPNDCITVGALIRFFFCRVKILRYISPSYHV